MIPLEVFELLPSAATIEVAARAGLGLLEERLRASGRGAADVLSLTLFVDACDAGAYGAARERLLGLVRDAFRPAPPPVTIVAEPPEARPLALEATVLARGARDVRVLRRECGGIAYSVAAGRGAHQVHAGGIGSSAAGDTAARAAEAFARMRAILDRERMGFSHVVRQWAYVEGLLDRSGADRQGYQAFNDARMLAYGRRRFRHGYPAATAIGQAAGGVLLEFVALRGRGASVVPLSSPRQTDAHRYGAGVLGGAPHPALRERTTPRFERGKRVSLAEHVALLVSGTAAILGERSVAPGDVALQTSTTLENIAALAGGEGLSHLRAYVKRGSDIATVRRICERAYGAIPAVYVRADVCRDELLVEIEGALLRPVEAARGSARARPRAKEVLR